MCFQDVTRSLKGQGHSPGFVLGVSRASLKNSQPSGPRPQGEGRTVPGLRAGLSLHAYGLPRGSVSENL